MSGGWSIGDAPSPSGVAATDRMQIVTRLFVETRATSTGGGWAYATATVSATLARMQGYHY